MAHAAAKSPHTAIQNGFTFAIALTRLRLIRPEHRIHAHLVHGLNQAGDIMADKLGEDFIFDRLLALAFDRIANPFRLRLSLFGGGTNRYFFVASDCETPLGFGILNLDICSPGCARRLAKLGYDVRRRWRRGLLREIAGSGGRPEVAPRGDEAGASGKCDPRQEPWDREMRFKAGETPAPRHRQAGRLPHFMAGR
jgi:hypothetical protein